MKHKQLLLCYRLFFKVLQQFLIAFWLLLMVVHKLVELIAVILS